MTHRTAASGDAPSPAASRAAEPAASGRFRLLLLAALILTGLSMRTAVTSVGAVLADLQADLHMSGAISGVVTTLPVICFALIGATAPRLAGRFGAHPLTVAAMTTMTVGLVARAAVSSTWAFILLSVLALTGGAITNVLMPSLVKRYFPDRIGIMTGAYATAMAAGTTAAAGLTVPFGRLAPAGEEWRTGLASWALFSIVAVLPWLAILHRSRGRTRTTPPVTAMLGLRHSKTAWSLTIFFGSQSLLAYVAFGWFAKFYEDHGLSAVEAGWLAAMVPAMQIPLSVVVPALIVRRPRPLILILSGFWLAAFIGMMTAPLSGRWVWMVLAGTGGTLFPGALTLIGMRARQPGTTAALSAFAQTTGYLIAGTGPVLFGALHGLTGSWNVPIIFLIADLVVALVSGLAAARTRYVDDDMRRPPRPGRPPEAAQAG